MNKTKLGYLSNFFVFFLGLSIILGCPGLILAQDWEIETADAQFGSGYYSSIALSAFNSPHIAYSWATWTSSQLRRAYISGSLWTNEELTPKIVTTWSASIFVIQ